TGLIGICKSSKKGLLPLFLFLRNSSVFLMPPHAIQFRILVAPQLRGEAMSGTANKLSCYFARRHYFFGYRIKPLSLLCVSSLRIMQRKGGLRGYFFKC